MKLRAPMLPSYALLASLAATTSGLAAEPNGARRAATTDLRAVDAFAHIADEAERSRALFVEAGKVILHPRCVNCHPKDASPRQGEAMALHEPPMVRGELGVHGEGHGPKGQPCQTCHSSTNIEHARLPGHAEWALAPAAMAWHEVPLAEICAQLKDAKRNGGKTLAEIHRHMAHDTLVGWGWNPGRGREKAPGTQAAFGELIAAWIETGAHCPAATATAGVAAASP